MLLQRVTSTTLLIALVASTGIAAYRVRAAIHPAVTEHLENTRVQSQLGNREEAAGYAQSMLMGTTIHVNVDYGNSTQLEDCDKAVSGAFEMWENAIGHQVKFVRVDDPAEAEVKIRFDKNVKLKGQVVSGFINWSRKIEVTDGKVKPVFSADIKLRTTDPKGRLMSWEAMRHTCGHEFGHLFGLDDSKEIGKLMGPLDLRKPVTKPDESEVETVLAIREECKAIVQKSEKGSHAHTFSGECLCDHHH